VYNLNLKSKPLYNNMEKEDHSRVKDTREDKAVSHDRRSRMGVDPNPKKGGHGGWGNYQESDPIEYADKGDPNFDPEENAE